MSQWIRCEDSMPQDSETVLIMTGYMQTAFWDGDMWVWGDESWWPDVVTHWMPLPEPPEGV